MGLWLPNSATKIQESKLASNSNIGYFHSLNEFTGSRTSIAELIRHLSAIRRSDVIRVIANISASIWSEHGMTHHYQMQMAQHLLPDEIWTLIREKLPFNDQHVGRLFYRRQVWFLFQMAIVACSETAAEQPSAEVQKKVGHAALMVSDVIEQIEHTHMPELEEAPDTNQWIATAMISLIDYPAHNEMICRAICFWMESQDDPLVRSKMQELKLTESLDDYFAKAHGITLRDFIRILVRAYYVFHVGAMSNPPKVQLLNPAAMKEKQFTTEQIAKAFSIAGIAPDNLAPYLLAARQSWATDFSPIRSKPLIEVFEGKYTCPDARIFGGFFMEGIYDILLEIIPGDNARQLFGTLFERYINIVLEDCLKVPPPLARRFAKDPKYFGENHNDQAGDGIILMSDFAVLMEYKGGMLTRRQKYATDLRDTITGIESLLARTGKGKKGIGQLVDNIERILNGEHLRVATEVLDISQKSKIIPALVVYDDSLTLHAVRNHVEGKFLAEVHARKLTEQRIGPLCVLSIRDIESIQGLSSGVSVETIFREYCDYLVSGGSQDVTGSFHGFVHQRFQGRQTQQSFVQSKTETLRNAIIKELEASLTENDHKSDTG